MIRLRDDEGFSLSELVVVLGLLGMILAAAWASYSVASNGTRASDRSAMTAREMAAPLLQCERLLIQQHNILDGDVEGRTINPTPYLIAFNTDMDRDSHMETTIIEATTGGELIISQAEVSEHTLEPVIWSTANRNRAAGVPLFRYYRADGTEITQMDAVASDARAVRITVLVEYEGTQYSDYRDLTFRNR